MIATWAGLGASISVLQTIIGPDAALDVGLVVNIGLVLAAVGIVFHAGSTFRKWLSALEASEKERRAQRDLAARLAATERLVNKLLALQGIPVPPPEEDNESD